MARTIKLPKVAKPVIKTPTPLPKEAVKKSTKAPEDIAKVDIIQPTEIKEE